MRDASTYRAAQRRKFPQSKILKWERKRRGMTRSQLDRERGETMNKIQAFHTAAKASM